MGTHYEEEENQQNNTYELPKSVAKNMAKKSINNNNGNNNSGRNDDNDYSINKNTSNTDNSAKNKKQYDSLDDTRNSKPNNDNPNAESFAAANANQKQAFNDSQNSKSSVAELNKNASNTKSLEGDFKTPTPTSPSSAAAKIALDVAKKIQNSFQNINEHQSREYTAETTKKSFYSTDNPQTTVAVIVAPFVALIFIVVMIMYSIITLTAAPILALYNGTNSAWGRVSSFISEIGKDKVSYIEVSTFVMDMIDKAFEESYLKTCYREVYQIAIEKRYDLEYTIESYNETEYPYFYDGEFCNINYSELLGIMSLSPILDYENFDYDQFKSFFLDQEFLRCLYDLDVIETEGIKVVSVPDGVEVVKHSRQKITFHFDGYSETYDVTNIGPYCKKVIYGEVKIDKYVLKKIYDYFNVDPYALNDKIPNMTNHQLLSTYDSTTRVYQDVDWGTAERTPILDYKKFTGQITEFVENIFAKDIHNDPVLSETKVFLDTTEYKQGDSRWGSLKYGSGNMAKLGCCVTALAIVCDYYNESQTITPQTILEYINTNYNGLLYNQATAKAFGVPVYNKTQDVNVKAMIGELKNERLIIAHIAPYQKGTGKYGHYVVLNGYEAIGSEGFFHVTEPASRLDSTISLAESVMVFDSYVSYGRK